MRWIKIDGKDGEAWFEANDISAVTQGGVYYPDGTYRDKSRGSTIYLRSGDRVSCRTPVVEVMRLIRNVEQCTLWKQEPL